MKVNGRKGKTAEWLSKWEVWNPDAPERRIWRVSYGRVPERQSRSDPFIDLEGAVARLRVALQDIYTFSDKHDCGAFTISFARAIKTLDSRGSALRGYDGIWRLKVVSFHSPDACQRPARRHGFLAG